MNYFLNSCFYLLEKAFLPYHCVLCLNASNQRRDLCCQCQSNLPASLHTCLQCGVAISTTQGQLRCGQCILHPPYFDDTVVGFDYQTPIDGWLKQFKFHKKGLYARILSEIYAEKLRCLLEISPANKPQALVPMPLHWRRIAQRGFNQAYIIAHYLSRKLDIPIIKHACVTRVKCTQPQSSLRQQARHHNILGAFSIQNLTNIEHVAIIDDIITTGSTVNELSQHLKLNGIKYVSVWALARVN